MKTKINWLNVILGLFGGLLIVGCVYLLSSFLATQVVKTSIKPEYISIGGLLICLIVTMVMLFVMIYKRQNKDNLYELILIQTVLNSIHSEISNDARIEREIATKVNNPKDNNIRAESMQKAADIVSRYLDMYKTNFYKH